MPNILDDDLTNKPRRKNHRVKIIRNYALQTFAFLGLLAFLEKIDSLGIHNEFLFFLAAIWLINSMSIFLQADLHIGRAMVLGLLLLLFDIIVIVLLSFTSIPKLIMPYGTIVLISVINMGIIELIRR